MGGIVDLAWISFEFARSVLPVWALVLIAAIILGFFARGAWSNRATDIARRTLKRAARERGAAREALEAEAVDVVRSHPQGLVMVADTALAAGRNQVAQAAVSALRASRSLPSEVRRIERVLDGPMPGSAFEAVILVERLLEQGQADLAKDRLQKCRTRWPLDEDLTALSLRIDQIGGVSRGAAVDPAVAAESAVGARDES